MPVSTTDCNHEFETTNGLMHVCKHCGVGRRQPHLWPVSDTAIDAVTILNRTAYIRDASYNRELYGPDTLELELYQPDLGGNTDNTKLRFTHVGPEVAKAIVEGGMSNRWSLVLVSDKVATAQESKVATADSGKITSRLHDWLAASLTTLERGDTPDDELTEEGERLLERARACWLRGVFAEANVVYLSDLRVVMRQVRRELVHLENAKRLLAEEQDGTG